MLESSYPFYLAGEPQAPNEDLEVLDKYTGAVATRVALAGPAEIELAIARAWEARRPMRELAAYERRDVLLSCAERFEERAEELAQVLCVEAGKPIRTSRGEVGRLVDTFRVAAEEAMRIGGELLPLDVTPRARGYRGMWKRVPAGVCSFITPFNFPLNLVAHKIAPAIAAGCPFVLKPAEKTPVAALILGEILAEAELPHGAWSILPCDVADAGPFTTDPRIALLSFTGSPLVGWALKARAGRKRVTLELGGNAAVIVDEDADAGDAAVRIVSGAFDQSGQSCISVQRIYVHESIADELQAKLTVLASSLSTGDPRLEQTVVGPLIDQAAADRVALWIQEAVDGGARVIAGGGRKGNVIEPTLLTGVDPDAKLCKQEAFGPVAVVQRVESFDEALRLADASEFGLQAGIFTRDLYKAQRAWDELEVGGVIIGDVPSWRADHMPYGGVKSSGLGREGLRWAIEDMTEVRMMVVRTP